MIRRYKLNGFAALLLILIAASFISDHIGITERGFSKTHILFVAICLILALVSSHLQFQPLAFIRKKYTHRKKELLLMVCSSILFLCVCDLILRLSMPPAYRATKYGWDIPANMVHRDYIEDSPGNVREITVHYFENGFKRWGDVHTEKIKMLIIGDSVTQMNWVSNGEEWYSYLEKEFAHLELFVHGGGGYGSLQEFMILDDSIDTIKPHVIVLQFCGNDFDNNVYALDRKNYPDNNHAVRPYLENEKIVYRLPLPLPKLREYSFIADRILKIYDTIMWRLETRDLQARIRQKKMHSENMSKQEREAIERLQQDAFAVTNRIMAMIKKRADGTPVFFLNIADSRGEEVCKANDFIYIPGIGEYIASKEEEGYRVRVVNDAHWNRLGNELAGQRLVDYFKNNRDGSVLWHQSEE